MSQITMGIDVSTKSLACVLVTTVGSTPKFIPYELEAEGAFEERFRRLSLLFDHFMQHNNGAYYDDEAVEQVIIEDVPFVQGQNGLRIAQILGMVKSTLVRFGIPVRMVNVSTWKKQVVGSGRASKEEIRAWAEGAWGIIRPLGSQNQYDALAIASYGVLVEGEPGTQAAAPSGATDAGRREGGSPQDGP